MHPIHNRQRTTVHRPPSTVYEYYNGKDNLSIQLDHSRLLTKSAEGKDLTPAIVNDQQALILKEFIISPKNVSINFQAWNAVILKSVTLSGAEGYIRVGVTNLQQGFQMIQDLQTLDLINWAQPDMIVPIENETVNDQYFPEQHQINATNQIIDGDTIQDYDINVQSVWNYTKGHGIKVAIIDDGLEQHEDLNTIDTTYNPHTGNSGVPEASQRHGVAVSGIIAARHNTIGIAGIAPDVELIGANIFTSGTTISEYADAITWAVNQGADVINNSWGFKKTSGSALCLENPYPVLTSSIQNALTSGRSGKGCIVVFASGNFSNPTEEECVAYPANIDGVLSVGAINPKGEKSTYSNYGPKLDFVAPSSDIISQQIKYGVRTIDRMGAPGYSAGNYHLYFGGTSAAAPAVSASAALLLSVDTSLTHTEVYDLFRLNAREVDSIGFDDRTGHELIDVGAAVQDIFNPLSTYFLCGADSIVLKASTLDGTGYTYLWNTGATADSIKVSPPSDSTFAVTVTDASCGTSEASMKVLVDQPLTTNIIASNDFICLGDSITITASGGSQYVWNTGSKDSFIYVAPTYDSTYTVTISNGGACEEILSKTIFLNEVFINISDNTTKAGNKFTVSTSGHGGDCVGGDVNESFYIQSFDISAQTTDARGISFNPDSTVMHISDQNEIFQYDLSVAVDISSATYDDVFDLTSGGSPLDQSYDHFFRDNGTRLFVVDIGAGDEIVQYDLTVAWDIGTASYNDSDVGPNYAQGLSFKADGLRYYVADHGFDDIVYRNLSSAWDITTDVSSGTFDIGSKESVVTGVGFSPNGDRMYVVGGTDKIHEWGPSTAWDLSAGVTFTDFFDFSFWANDIQGLFVDPSGKRFFVVDIGSDEVHEFRIGCIGFTSSNKLTKLVLDYEATTHGQIGLTDDNSSFATSNIEYGFYVDGIGGIKDIENGVIDAYIVNDLTTSDTISVRIEGSSVKLYRNSTVLHTYTDTPPDSMYYILNAEAASVATFIMEGCEACPPLPLAPIVSVTESTCDSVGATPSGGAIAAGGSCPSGSTKEYSTDNTTFNTSLPTYNDTIAITVYTRCVCDLNNDLISDTSQVTTVPGVCPTGTCPDLSSAPATVVIVNSTCNEVGGTPSGGSISAGAACPQESDKEYSLDNTNWSAALPAYDQDGPAQTVYTRCKCTVSPFTTSPVSQATTSPGTCPTEQCPTLITPNPVGITNSTCTVIGGTPSSGVITATSGCLTGSFLQYSTNGGTWTTTVPVYDQDGPAQTVRTRCKCDLTGETGAISQATTAPGTCPACANVTTAGTISGNQSNCGYFDPTTITSTASASGGAGGTIQYQWQTRTLKVYPWGNISGATSTTYDPPNSYSKYYRRLAKRTCSSSWLSSNEVIIRSPASPSPSISGPSSICTGKTTTITASVSVPFVASSYAWSPATGLSSTTIANPMANPASTTIYTVTVTDDNGCTGTASKTLTVHENPTASISGTTTICVSGNVTITASGGVIYSWDNGLGSGSQKTVSPATTTTYTVTVTDVNGCTDTESVTVTVSPIPDVVMTTPDTICDGDQASYSWTATTPNYTCYGSRNGHTVGPFVTSSTIFSFTELGTGLYWLSVVDANGCYDSFFDEITVHGNPTASISGTTTICNGSSTTLIASGAVIYSWSHGLGSGSSKNVSPNSNTTYTITATDANGCTDTESTVVTVNQIPNISLTNDSICDGDQIEWTWANSGGPTWNYNDNGGSGTTTSTSRSFTEQGDGTYTITVTDNSTGCSDTESRVITVSPEASFETYGLSVSSGSLIYSNPCSNFEYLVSLRDWESNNVDLQLLISGVMTPYSFTVIKTSTTGGGVILQSSTPSTVSINLTGSPSNSQPSCPPTGSPLVSSAYIEFYVDVTYCSTTFRVRFAVWNKV